MYGYTVRFNRSLTSLLYATDMGWQTDKRLDGKTAVITGASSGIGKYVALDLYRRGARVILPCLSRVEAESAVACIEEEVGGEGVRGGVGEGERGELVIKVMDLSSLESVRQCAQLLLQEEEAIHFLINNAGVFISDQTLSQDGFQIHFAVNYLGHFLFTMLLLPLLLKSAPARILNTASDVHYLGKPINADYIKKVNSSALAGYTNSKFAVASFTKELSRKLEGTGVTVYSTHPGIVDTPMSEKFLASYNFFIRTVIKIVAKPVVKTPKEAAETILYCALDDGVAAESGFYYCDCKRKHAASKCEDPKTAKELWDLSINLLDLEHTNLLAVNT
ncbi:retinol dehydrogenase 12 [Nilaparvata lugens]|uniref:retinol dehydrogenase 12 n=1 Tax=Nilaparvata lugens TaxID=108931 RepID=UPI00193E1C88|nr:retinol dehydrogenase 12 [Nilaparvata lugens]XP_039289384.1 retinol dehydrogenase 12 [Nilaparvata lugens]